MTRWRGQSTPFCECVSAPSAVCECGQVSRTDLANRIGDVGDAMTSSLPFISSSSGCQCQPSRPQRRRRRRRELAPPQSSADSADDRCPSGDKRRLMQPTAAAWWPKMSSWRSWKPRPQPAPRPWSSSRTPVVQLLWLLLLTLLSTSCGHRWLPVAGAEVPPAPLGFNAEFDFSSTSLEAYRPLREKEICPSMDIRNQVKELRELENCTVVEGFVHILLIEHNNASIEYLNHSYPKLREITGYLLLFRANGLQSLRNLFPNLSVIRGQVLFHDYALVVYEMMQLQELGLSSLTDIQRGSVLIEKNPNLCFVESIDWNSIAKAGRDGLFIKDNMNPLLCPSCPSHCPVASDDGRRLCWTNDDCQRVCDIKQCSACSWPSKLDSNSLMAAVGGQQQQKATCCHEECLGGCTGSSATDCHVCRNIVEMKDGRSECRPNCRPGTYLYLNRRCVTDAECANMPAPRELQDQDVHWKPFNDKCILECPTGFKELKKYSLEKKAYFFTCEKCDGPCPKECVSRYVTNIETAQSLKGCTKINGNLEIYVKGGQSIVRELEDNLQFIEEIDGYLKVARSYPLVSLNFLRNLKVIHGNQLENDEFALVLMDNQNLAQLWDWNRKPDFKLKKGKLFVHFNPKLCPSQIDELSNLVKKSTGLEQEVSQSSNGEKATCNDDLLTLDVAQISSLSVVIRWNDYRRNMSDPRALLGYVISYIEAPYKNVTFYDGRDACGGDGWKIVDVGPNDTEGAFISELKPYTQYAIYVQTFTVVADRSPQRSGARSNITYFRTRSYVPDQPQDLRATAESDTVLRVEWKTPKNPNGVVSYYMVFGHLTKDEQEYYDKRNYCHDQLTVSGKVSGASGAESENPSANRTGGSDRNPKTGDSVTGIGSGGSNSGASNLGGPSLVGGVLGTSQANKCDCDSQCSTKEAPSLDKKEKEQQFRISFENYLHNKVYVKQRGSKVKRTKREDAATTMTTVSSETATSSSSSSAAGAIVDNATANGFNNKEFPVETNHGANTDPRETLNNTEHLGFSFHYQVANNTSFRLENLRHFAQYTIEVQTCLEADPTDPKGKKYCSMFKAVTSARTKPRDSADNIPEPIKAEVSNQTMDSVKISWEEPPQPNGLILKYVLEYKKVEGDGNAEPRFECVRRKDFVDANKTKVLANLAAGNYSVRVRAISLSGPGHLSNPIYFTIEAAPGSIGAGTIAGIFVVVLFFCGVAFSIGGYYIMKKKRNFQDLITSINPDYHKYVPDSWEAARENVEVIRELGQGSFGMVYEGIVRNVVEGQPEARCAVKTVNEKASVTERIQFLNEASVMKEFKAHHVVKLLGVVSKGQPTLVIMELMANGDLKSYLRSHRPDSEENVSQGRQPPTLKCILKMAIEIADGMAYLAEKKFVHRDLAARNCMVAEDMTVKIGDFGMTRDIYETDYYRKGGKGLLPVRWMAPESLRDGVFTTQCDVWSFGVVLWEMATLASQPYQGLSNEQVLKYVMDAGVMERPDGCPSRLYKLMQWCWRYNPRLRPTFLDIIEDLLPDIPAAQFAAVSFYHSDAGVNARSAQKTHQEQDRLHHEPAGPLQSLEIYPSSLDAVDGGGSDHERFSLVNLGAGDRVLQIDEEGHDNEEEDDLDVDEDDHLCGLQHRQHQSDDVDSHDDSDGEQRGPVQDDIDDHVPVLYPNDRRAYILVRNPAAGASNGGGFGGGSGNGSKASDASSKGTTIPSEDSKGSYVSNGSASNGYVKGILRHRTEC